MKKKRLPSEKYFGTLESVFSFYGAMPTGVTIGSDGIAISEDGKTLYYCPLASRDLYSIETDVLRDESIPDSTLYSYVKYLGRRVHLMD